MNIFLMSVSMSMFLMSPHFINAWVMLECMTLGFLSMGSMFQSYFHKYGSVSSYFIIQVIGSSLLLISFSYGAPFNCLNPFWLSLYTFSLVLKIGIFPFHGWVVSLTRNLSWYMIFILGTFMKFIPLVLLSWGCSMDLLIFISIMTMLISAYSSLGLTDVKSIMGYSMVSHTSWMVIMIFSIKLCLFYYIMYSLLFMLVCYFHDKIELIDLSKNFKNSKSSSYCFMTLLMYLLNLISLMGVPPLVGFMIKLMVLDTVNPYVSYVFMLTFVFAAAVHMYMYLLVGLAVLSNIFSNCKLNLMTNLGKKSLPMYVALSLLINLLPFFYYFM